MSKATPHCPFCSPDERILKENEHAQVLLSDPRKVPGHILVIPKRHVLEPWALRNEELLAIFELVFFVERKLLGVLGTGVDIRQNYRPFLKQGRLKVDHIHFHVIPRDYEDYIYSVAEKYETDLFADLDPAEAAEVAKLLSE